MFFKSCRTGWRQEKGTTEDEMAGWHHWLSGHEFEQALGDGEGQQSLACCSLWGRKELDMTEQQQEVKKVKLQTEKQKLSLQTAVSLPLSLPHEDTARRQPSARQEESWDQDLAMLTPWSQRPNFENCMKIHSCCLSHSVYDTLFWQLELVKTELRGPLN